MNAVTRWYRSHRAISSVVVISLVVGVPLTFAAINPGYPVTDVQLTARDVWVTKGGAELAGRVNTQVDQLDASVPTISHDFDVLQDGETIFLNYSSAVPEVLSQVNPNTVSTGKATTSDLPPGAVAQLDGGVLAVLSAAGTLWRVPIAQNSVLDFDYHSTPAVHIPRLGAGSKLNVERDGTVDVATRGGTLYQLDASTGSVSSSSIPKLSNFQLSSVGTVPVILDLTTHSLIASGVSRPAPRARELQQPGDAAAYALLETPGGLQRIDLGSGAASNVAVKGASGTRLVRPVHMGSCDNGIWPATATVVYACPGASLSVNTLKSSTGAPLAHDRFAFRVNQLSVALNDLTNGYSWLVNSANAIKDWKSVPPQQQSPKTGKDSGKNVTFVQTPPKFSPVNHEPKAVDDAFGVRSQGTTALPVLKNDTDPDGDVLAVTSITDTPAAFGSVQLGGGGESPQFTPAPGAKPGSALVRYSISDGRGGRASAAVKITIVPDDVNHKPAPTISASLIVEQGQTVTYNVLIDWVDPDGDAMQVVGATAASADSVRFTPDGYITFRSTSGLGVKTVHYTVQDSAESPLSAQGTLTVDVKAAGSTAPTAESDYGSGFAGSAITVSPLTNDRAPSGQPLQLQSVKQVVGNGPTPTINSDKGTIQFSENRVGSYEFEYTETAGTSSKSSLAFIRLDVMNPSAGHVAPVAVSDVAYLTYPGTVTVPVLDNDVSPEGLVLGVQSISPPQLPAFTAQLLSNTTVKITATGAPASNKPVIVPYTISDGTTSVSASITVVPVSQLVNHLAPITTDDVVTVRAGEVATASVLDNDVDPDGAAMSVAQTLAEAPKAGLAFVTGNDVRFEAPSVVGQYVAVYKVTDTAGEKNSGRVVFNVRPATSKGNRPPQPAPVVSRVFTGGSVRVQIPLAGIDPDGDTALLESIPQNPRLGTITDVTSTYFDYQARSATGTDTFNYEVTDQFGAIATATASIGIIPRAGTGAPTAVDDTASLRPGSSGTVDVLANDSDPNGYAVSIVPRSLKNVGAKPISASIVGSAVVLHAGRASGSFTVQYSITDGHTKAVSAFIHVTVSKTAANLPPIAIDHVLQLKDVQSGKPVKVAVRAGASDPSGVVSTLVVALAGKVESKARRSGGSVFVTPSHRPSVVGYTLTDPFTHLTSTAFILVPAIPPKGWNLLPYIRKDLAQQLVKISTPTEFDLEKIVYAPSHLATKIVDRGQLSATHGTVKYTDPTHFTFTPSKGYAGPATITFHASDTDHPANAAQLMLPVTVTDTDGSDVKPTFTTAHVQVAQKSSTSINLVDQTGNSQHVTYSGLTGGTTLVTGTLSSGSQQGMLTVTAAESAAVGRSVVFRVKLSTPSGYDVVGEVIVKVVKTTAPLPQANTDPETIKLGAETVIHPLANDVNPSPDTPLKIVDVTSDNASAGTINGTSKTTVTYTPAVVGTVHLQYTIEDAFDRRVTGIIAVNVVDAPAAPLAPTEYTPSSGSQTIGITVNATTTDNGDPVTSYTVTRNPGSVQMSCAVQSTDCTFRGLDNGTPYTFTVAATNHYGTSAASPALNVTPYGTPASVSATASPGPGVGQVSVSWSPTTDSGGGTASYAWRQHSASAWIAANGSFSETVTPGAGNSTSFDVEVCNLGNQCSVTTTGSATAPSPQPHLTIAKGATPPSTTCNAAACRYVAVTGTNFPANATVSVEYDTDHGGSGAFTTRTYQTDGSGSFTADDVYYSYSGYNVWVNSAGAPQSNTIAW